MKKGANNKHNRNPGNYQRLLQESVFHKLENLEEIENF
jgi:hypothetical protein